MAVPDDRIPRYLSAPWQKVLRSLRSRRPNSTRELQDLFTEILAGDQVTGLYRSYVQEWEDLPEAFRSGRTAAL